MGTWAGKSVSEHFYVTAFNKKRGSVGADFFSGGVDFGEPFR